MKDRTPIDAQGTHPKRLMSRRLFVGQTLALTGASALPSAPLLQVSAQRRGPLFDLLRPPDLVRMMAGAEGALTSMHRGGNTWSAPGAELQVTLAADHVSFALLAPNLPVHRIHLRWRGALDLRTRVLGDAWERSYADLAWLPLRAERVLPW